MEQITEQLCWDFPGGVPGIAFALLVLFGIAFFSYRNTLREISFSAKLLLIFLRCILFALIVLCLANPRMETTRTVSQASGRKIALIVDESESMMLPDLWKRSRFQDACSFLRERIPSASGNIQVDHYRFGSHLRAVKSIDAPAEDGNQQETRLFECGAEWSRRFAEEGYDGVVCLTDGIDTSGELPDQMFAAFAASPLKQIFIPMRNELPASPSVVFQKIESPSMVYPGMEHELLFLVRCGNLSSREEIQLELTKTSDSTVLFTEKISPGNGMRMVRYRYSAAVPGTERLCARLIRNGKDCGQIRWSVECVEKKDTFQVLVYCGALDFGVRFLKQIFPPDGTVRLDIRFAHGVFPSSLKRTSDLPEAGKLAQYDAVMLLNMKRSEMRKHAEDDLYEFVKKGGGLLFVAGNPSVATEYAQSRLERLLPVTFSVRGASGNRTDPHVERILKEISRSGDGTRYDRDMVARREFTFRPEKLTRFELTDLGKKSPVFRRSGGAFVIPEFQDSALADGLKPGANLLAYHKGKGKTHPLFAVQNFGSGRSAVLGCDPLWRWRMNTPSDDPAFEIFWKNIFSWITFGKNRAIRWHIPNLVLPADGVLKMVLETGEGAKELRLFQCRMECGGTTSELPLHLENGKLTAESRLEPGKDYVFRAFQEGRIAAEFHYAAVQKDAEVSPERRSLEPDLEMFRLLARQGNVKVTALDGTFSPDQEFRKESVELREKEMRPLWHAAWLFLLIGTVYLAELVLRRRFQLI